MNGTATAQSEGRITSRVVERVREAANIVDVVGGVLSLKRRGLNYTALCPFHDDRKTGSFIINPRHNNCLCYSCMGETARPLDSIEFVRRYYNVSFVEAVRMLARRYGIYEAGATGVQTAKELQRRPPVRVQGKEMKAYDFGKLPECKRETYSPLYGYLSHIFESDSGTLERFREVWEAYKVRTCDGVEFYNCLTWTIFPYINDSWEILTAKYMKYLSDGHRDRGRYSVDWLHALRQRCGSLQLQAGEYIGRTLFGMHRLGITEGTVSIVESEKSAIIAQTLCGPCNTFMATGGAARLSFEMLSPILHARRSVVLYPDRDKWKEWEQACKDINEELKRKRMRKTPFVKVSTWLLDSFTKSDGEKADIADVLLRKYKEQGNE